MTGIFTVLIFIILPVITGILFIYGKKPDLEQDRNEALALSIDELLPQSQCGDCGHPGCRPYAEAIVAGKADIYNCPPGGENTIRLMAVLLGRTIVHHVPGGGHGVESRVAYINEQACIGCVKCIKACPVDAIIGAAGQMHTVMPKVCTGCELCISPCPVNCISMIPAETRIKKFVWNKPQQISPVNRT